MIDLHIGQDAMLLEDPIYLLLLAPHQIPIIIPGLLPLPTHQAIVDAVLEGSFKLDGGSSSFENYGAMG
jgi:hypothetical protein